MIDRQMDSQARQTGSMHADRRMELPRVRRSSTAVEYEGCVDGPRKYVAGRPEGDTTVQCCFSCYRLYTYSG